MQSERQLFIGSPRQITQHLQNSNISSKWGWQPNTETFLKKETHPTGITELVKVDKKAAEVMQGVPSHHGLEHAQEVARWNVVLTSLEGGNAKQAYINGMLHDVRWIDDSERQQRGLTVKLNKLPQLNASGEQPSLPEIVFNLYQNGVMNRDDAAAAFLAIPQSSLLPVSNHREHSSVKTLRDADRLSRFGLEGIASVLRANKTYGEPLYNEGDLNWLRKRSLMPFKEINTCIKDIISCMQWEMIAETDTGKNLMKALNPVGKQFLKVFGKNSHITDYEIWIGWLESIIKRQEGQREALKNTFANAPKEYMLQTLALNDPSLLSEESLNTYLNSTSKIY